jgi:hypothetical protein
LHWAIRDELPKGQAVAASPWDVITQFCALGTRIQTGGYAGDGFGFTPGAPHEDALVIADAVRSLGSSRFADAAEVLPLFGEWAPIAGDAVSAILCGSFDQRSLVISNATMVSRPKWKFELPTPYQMFTPSSGGRPSALVHGTDADGDIVALKPNRGRAAKRDGLYSYAMAPRSPLAWLDPSMISIGECRAEYVAWRAALCVLARDLSGMLKEFEPTAPAVAALPWITGETPASRVVATRDLGDDEPQFLTPRRDEASRRPIGNPRASKVRFVEPAKYVPQETSKTVTAIG